MFETKMICVININTKTRDNPSLLFTPEKKYKMYIKTHETIDEKTRMIKQLNRMLSVSVLRLPMYLTIIKFNPKDDNAGTKLAKDKK